MNDDGMNSVTNPPYYSNGGIASKDALESMMSDCDLIPVSSFWWGCAFKYLWRWPKKNGIEDLEKCRQCIEYLIESMEKDESAEDDDVERA